MSFAGAVHAQTCPPYGVTDAYRAAAASGAPHAIVRGTLRFDPEDWPRGGKGRSVRAELEGVALGALGLREVFFQKIRVSVECPDGLCPGMASGDVLAFLRREGTRFVTSISPCQRQIFRSPIPAAMHYVQDCLDQTACPSGAQILQALIDSGDVLPPPSPTETE